MRFDFLIVILLLVFYACSEEADDSENRYIRILDAAYAAYDSSNYDLAEEKVDSLKGLYTLSPIAVRRDSLIALITEVRDSIKKQAAIERKELLEKKIAQLRVEVDDMRDLKFYYDKSTTNYVDRKAFYLYIASSEKEFPALRVKIQYKDDTWLFVRGYTIKADSVKLKIQPDYGDIERDNSYGRVWEYYDGNVNEEQLAFFIQMAAAKEVKLRYNGDKYYDDRVIPKKELKAMANILEVYGLMVSDHLSDLE